MTSDTGATRPSGSTRTSSDASRPSEFHKRDLKAIARRTKDEIKTDNLGLLAAGVSFYAFLSIFPALTALVSIYALFADPAQVEQQMQAASGVLPGEAQGVLQDQLHRITQSSSGALGSARSPVFSSQSGARTKRRKVSSRRSPSSTTRRRSVRSSR